MVGVARVRASVNLLLLDLLDALIFEPLLDFEKLLSCGLICWVASCTDRVVPRRALSAEEVPVDRLLDIADDGFRTLVSRVRVLVPPVEARLVPRIIQLTVMD